MTSWFVRPDTTTLTLSDGRTITVRERLTTGERRAARKRVTDPADGSMALVSAYLLDWTIVDDNGPVPIARLSVADLIAVLDNLDPRRFDEIVDALEGHIADKKAERDAEKKTDGMTKSTAISPLPFDAAGRSATSET